jgi:hypothetical protein
MVVQGNATIVVIHSLFWLTSYVHDVESGYSGSPFQFHEFHLAMTPRERSFEMSISSARLICVGEHPPCGHSEGLLDLINLLFALQMPMTLPNAIGQTARL